MNRGSIQQGPGGIGPFTPDPVMGIALQHGIYDDILPPGTVLP